MKAFLKTEKKIVNVVFVRFNDLGKGCVGYIKEVYFKNVSEPMEALGTEDLENVLLLPSLGLKDRDNNEIFLHDIVKYLGDEIGIVKYDLGCFFVEFDGFILSLYNNTYDKSEFEIIGNYYTDSYLLDPYLDFLRK